MRIFLQYGIVEVPVKDEIRYQGIIQIKFEDFIIPICSKSCILKKNAQDWLVDTSTEIGNLFTDVTAKIIEEEEGEILLADNKDKIIK